MKRIILLFAGLLAINVYAQDASQLRIYLNPGHGSWGPDDRPMATIPYPATLETGRPDTCGFYESNTNLWKTLAIGERLIANGFKKENVVHSRTQNGPYPYVAGAADAEKYNRNLTEICEEVEAGNFDMFLSVHSNAAAEGAIANYPLFLYRGHDDGSMSAPGSREMSETLWPYLMSNGIDYYTAYSPTNTNIRGDIDFYHAEYSTTLSNGKTYVGYLGVLKHSVPGFLAEGYFHTYQPARHRALNKDYCAQEGVRYFRGILDYFGLPDEKVGYIMGTVKDSKNRISHSLFNYASGSNDQWFPINGAVVKLLKDGQEVAEYTVDNNYNGVFVFSNLEPGDYTLECTAEHYGELADTYKNVTVYANETTYPKIFLEPESGYVPTISTETPEEKAQKSYAYYIRHYVSGDEHSFSFRTTASAKNATIVITNTETKKEKRFPAGEVIKGLNTLNIPESQIGYGTFNWAVEIENELPSKPTTFFRLKTTNSGSGVAVNTNVGSTYFGQVYFADSYATKGIHMLNADLSSASTSALFTSYFTGGNYYSPGRLAINPNNNNVYIADWSDAHSGIFYFSPAMKTRLNSFFTGTRDSDGRITNNSRTVGGSVSGICFQGEGDDTKLYAFVEDYPSANANRLCRYDVGTSKSWDTSPSTSYTTASGLMPNHNVCLTANDYGVWLSQIRYSGNNTTGAPSFVVMNNNGSIAINSATDLPSLNGCNGSLAINKDNTLLAIANGDTNIEIYKLLWSPAGTPSFTYVRTILNGNGAVSQMAFDHADNLFVSARNGNFAMVLPDGNPVVTTRSNDEITIIDPVGIETVDGGTVKLRVTAYDGTVTIECPVQTASISIYTPEGICIQTLKPIQGKAEAHNLPQGIYIVKAGKQTAKVLVE